MENQEIIPLKERKKLRVQVIRSFYRRGYSMDEICALSRRQPELFYSSSGLSKTTVFFAVKGRPKKKPVENKNNHSN